MLERDLAVEEWKDFVPGEEGQRLVSHAESVMEADREKRRLTLPVRILEKLQSVVQTKQMLYVESASQTAHSLDDLHLTLERAREERRLREMDARLTTSILDTSGSYVGVFTAHNFDVENLAKWTADILNFAPNTEQARRERLGYTSAAMALVAKYTESGGSRNPHREMKLRTVQEVYKRPVKNI